MKRLLGGLLVCGLFLTGCGGGSNNSSTPQVTLRSIAVALAIGTLIAGQTTQATATATYSDGSAKDVTSTAAWSSVNSSIATVTTSGLVTAVAAGQVNVQATETGVSGSAALTVTAKILTSIEVTPTNPTLAVGISQQFIAAGIYNDGSTVDMTNTASWSSSESSEASVTASGLVSTLTEGAPTILAASGGVQGSTTVTVPSQSGGLVLNTNTTDSLILRGQETDGTIDTFFGNRDASGIPQSFYAVTSAAPDGTLRSVQLDSQLRPLHASSSTGAEYDVQWLSETTGTITAYMDDGSASASAFLNTSTARGKLTRSSGARSHIKPFIANPASTTLPSVKVTATSNCVTPVPEPQANVRVRITSDAGVILADEDAEAQGDGTYLVDLPNRSGVLSDAAKAAQAAAASGLEASYCQANTSSASWCALINSALDKLAIPEDSELRRDCPLTIARAPKLCQTLQTITSYLDTWANEKLTLTASATLDGHEGEPNEETGPPFQDLSVKLPCETPNNFEVVPGSLTLTQGQNGSLNATLLEGITPVHSAAFTINWDSPGDPDGQFIIVGPKQGATTSVDAVNPGGPFNVTASVSGPGTGFLKPQASAVTVNPQQLSLTVTWTVTLTPSPLDTIGWNGTDKLTIANGTYSYVGTLTSVYPDGCVATRTESSSGPFDTPTAPTPAAPFSIPLSLGSQWTDTNAATGCENDSGNGFTFSGIQDWPVVTIQATPTQGGYTLSTNTTYPYQVPYGAAQTTVTASGFLSAP